VSVQYSLQKHVIPCNKLKEKSLPLHFKNRQKNIHYSIVPIRMKVPHECRNIEEVRREIDSIDAEIISLLGKRLDFIQAIVKYKNNADDVYATGRYNAVIDERRKMAILHRLDPDVIEKIYRLLMDYFIEEQFNLLSINK
jgi:isochorismate pyruvate lyase